MGETEQVYLSVSFGTAQNLVKEKNAGLRGIVAREKDSAFPLRDRQNMTGKKAWTKWQKAEPASFHLVNRPRPLIQDVQSGNAEGHCGD